MSTNKILVTEDKELVDLGVNLLIWQEKYISQMMIDLI